MVELKTGETFNGILCNCDFWMNVNLKQDGKKFWKLPECHIRGLNVKYIRIPDELLEKAKEENARRRQYQQQRSSRTGNSRGRGSGVNGSRGESRGGRGSAGRNKKA